MVCKGFEGQNCGERLSAELQGLDLGDSAHLRDFVHLVRVGELGGIKSRRVQMLVKQRYAQLFEGLIGCHLGKLMGLLREEKEMVAGDPGFRLEALIRRVYEQVMSEVKLPSKSQCFFNILDHLVVHRAGT